MGLGNMARAAAAEQADWNSINQRDEVGGNQDGAAAIMGTNGKPADSRELFARVRARLRAGVGEDVLQFLVRQDGARRAGR
jgi:DNA-binding response OmpR family regulator